jgi:uncharacterized protein YraI
MRHIRFLVALMLLAIMAAFVGNAVYAENSEQRVEFTPPILVVNTSFLNIRSGPGPQYSVLLTVVGGTELPVLAIASDNVWYQVSTVIGVGWVNSEFTVGRGSFDNIPVIRLSDVMAQTTVNPFPVAGGTMPMTSSTMMGASMTPMTTSALIPGVSCATRTTATINVTNTNVRSGPGENFPVLALLFAGGEFVDYPLVGSTGTWHQLYIGELNLTGWVSAGITTLHASGAIGLTVARTNADIYVAESPYSVERPLFVPAGTDVFVVGQNGSVLEIETISGDRARIDINSVSIRDLVNCSGGQGAAPVPGATLMPGMTAVPTFAGPQLATNQNRIVVNTAFLNIRSGPGAQYTTVATVNGGAELPVLGLASDGVWFLVSGPFGQGWVNNEFTVFRGVIETVPIIRNAEAIGVLARPVGTISAPVTLFAAPGANFGSIGTFGPASNVQVVARTADGAWVQISTPLGFGWVQTTQIAIQGDTSLIPVVR